MLEYLTRFKIKDVVKETPTDKSTKLKVNISDLNPKSENTCIIILIKTNKHWSYLHYLR